MSSTYSSHHHGQVICDRYLLQGVSGRGGAGVIYRALDLHSQTQVALKLAHRPTHSSPLSNSVPSPISDEFSLAQPISHPHIIQYLNTHIHDQRSVVVMEYIEASPFSNFLHPTHAHTLPISLKMKWIQQICDLVDTLHQHQVIHCDLKPQNF